MSPISKASAQQRSGRAGRTRPGKCFRLYTEASFESDLQEQTYPEILRSRMESVVLTLFKLGIEDLVHFDFMDPPAPDTMMRAIEELNYLGAIDEEGNLTDIGTTMCNLPVEPYLAKMLISAPKYNCSEEVLTIVSLLTGAAVFMRPREAAAAADEAKANFSHQDGDHITLLNAYTAYKEASDPRDYCYQNFLNYRSMQSADNVRSQLSRAMQRLNIPLIRGDPQSFTYYEDIQKALTTGLFMQVAHLQKAGKYLTAKDNQIVTIHPSSVLDTKPKFVIFQEFIQTKQNYIRTVSKIDVSWLVNIAPHYYDLENWPEGETKVELEDAYRSKALSSNRKRTT